MTSLTPMLMFTSEPTDCQLPSKAAQSNKVHIGSHETVANQPILGPKGTLKDSFNKILPPLLGSLVPRGDN